MNKNLLIIKGDNQARDLVYLSKKDMQLGRYKDWYLITPCKVVKPIKATKDNFLGWVVAHNNGYLANGTKQKRIKIFKYMTHAHRAINAHIQGHNSLRSPRLMALVRDDRKIELWRKADE